MSRTRLAAGIVSSSLGLLLALAGPAGAEPVAYPAKGQSHEQQSRDEYECHEWATKETGVDPVALAEQATAPSAGDGADKGTTGSAARGAGIGAMRGAASGGDVAGGAMHGAMMGRLVAAVRSRRQMEQQKQAGETANAAVHAQLEKYDQAYAACLTGRGYSVK